MKMGSVLKMLSTVVALNTGVAMADQGGSDEQLQRKKLSLRCQSAGAAMSTLGQDQADLEADIKFTLKVRDDGLRVIEKFRGAILLDGAQSVSQTLLAKFENEQAIENIDYAPRVYKGYSQFRNINGVGVVGSQAMAMVGNFLLEKKVNKDVIHAVYQFQAGDSLGGVLHLNCKKIN